jgi:hypothetical protein
MLAGVESRFQVGRIGRTVECRVKEGEKNLWWKKFGGNATRISADSAFISMNLYFLFYSYFLFSCLHCTSKHECHRKDWSKRSFVYIPWEYLQNCDDFAAVFPQRTCRNTYVPMWRCVVMVWRSAILHTIFSLRVASHPWLLIVSSYKSDIRRLEL